MIIKTASRSLTFAVILAAAIGSIAFLNGLAAHAQCRAVNNTISNVNLCVYNVLSAISCQVIPAGGNVVYGMPAGFNPLGVVSAGGVRYLFTPAPPATGSTVPISLLIVPTPPPPASPTICAVVTYNPSMCIFTISPALSPCAP